MGRNLTLFKGRWKPVDEVRRYYAPMVNSTSIGTAPQFNLIDPKEGMCEFIVGGKLQFSDLGSAGATPLVVIPESDVPPGTRIFITDVMIGSDATGAVGGTNIKIQDTYSAPVDFMTILTAALSANSAAFPGVANTTIEAAMRDSTGGVLGKGLQIRGAGTFTGIGSCKYRISGYFAP